MAAHLNGLCTSAPHKCVLTCVFPQCSASPAHLMMWAEERGISIKQRAAAGTVKAQRRLSGSHFRQKLAAAACVLDVLR